MDFSPKNEFLSSYSRYDNLLIAINGYNECYCRNHYGSPTFPIGIKSYLIFYIHKFTRFLHFRKKKNNKKSEEIINYINIDLIKKFCGNLHFAQKIKKIK